MRLFVISLRPVKRVGLQMLTVLPALLDRVVERPKRSFLDHTAGCATGTMSHDIRSLGPMLSSLISCDF
jgi:hypothetical protein